jgi:Plasmid pRiA4b ORF-3-like protein
MWTSTSPLYLTSRRTPAWPLPGGTGRQHRARRTRPGSRLRAIRCGDHPDTATLAEALTLFIASGGKPTSSQVYQLKISLKRMRNPIWCRVLVPAIARLGLLHQVIQIVMNWDGDHLHAFFVDNEHYGDPCNSPDLDDEERLRLGDAFTPSVKTLSR